MKQTPKHPHHCVAVLFACMDFRLHPELHAKLQEQYGHFDVMHLAGGPRNLIKPEAVDVVLRSFRISVEKHQAHTAVLVGHEDCGDYAYDGIAFDNDATEERARQRTDLQQEAAVLRRAFPELTIVSLFQLLDGSLITL